MLCDSLKKKNVENWTLYKNEIHTVQVTLFKSALSMLTAQFNGYMKNKYT